jgi:signal peptidase II
MQASNLKEGFQNDVKTVSFRPGRLFWLALCLVVAVVLADQYTKWLVLETVLRAKGEGPGFSDWFSTPRTTDYFAAEQANYKTDVLGPLFNLVMVWNKGISFGMFDANSAVPPLVFIGLSCVISAALAAWTAMAHKPLTTVAAALVIGGAFGNVADRIRFHAVADFIDFHVNDWHWPAFNLADSCIVAGACLLVLDSLLVRTKEDPAPHG